MSKTAYCPTCRKYLPVWWVNPPYSVLHASETEHRQPISRQLIKETA